VSRRELIRLEVDVTRERLWADNAAKEVTVLTSVAKRETAGHKAATGELARIKGIVQWLKQEPWQGSARHRGGACRDAGPGEAPERGFDREEDLRWGEETAEVVVIDNLSAEQLRPTDGNRRGARWEANQEQVPGRGFGQ
jgi:hypothetical protein